MNKNKKKKKGGGDFGIQLNKFLGNTGNKILLTTKKIEKNVKSILDINLTKKNKKNKN